MQWWRLATKLEKYEAGNTLIFRATEQQRYVDLLLPTASTIAFICVLLIRPNPYILFGLAALIAIPIFNWFRRTQTELRVTAISLHSESHAGGKFKITVDLNWAEVSGLEHYRANAEGDTEPTGLIAQMGTSNYRCIIPNLSQAQSFEAIDAIYRHFPYIKMAKVPESLGPLFEFKPVTLDLFQKE
jgi:hypothetical protein